MTGIPELVENGRTGLLVPQHQPEALAAAVRIVLTDPARAEAFARAGRARVEERFEFCPGQRRRPARAAEEASKSQRRVFGLMSAFFLLGGRDRRHRFRLFGDRAKDVRATFRGAYRFRGELFKPGRRWPATSSSR